MSVKVSSWVWHDAPQTVNGNDLILLLALADVADDNGRCRFVDDDEGLTYAALSGKARVSRSTVIRIVARLREAGLIEHVPGVKGHPNEFRVIVPWAERSGANLTPNGSDSVSPEPQFGVNDDDRSSLIRKDVLSGAPKRTTIKGSRMTEGWKPSPALLAWAVIHTPSVEPLRETERFVDYWIAAPGAKGVKSDWDATWRNWMRSTHERNVERGWRAPIEGELSREEWMLR